MNQSTPFSPVKAPSSKIMKLTELSNEEIAYSEQSKIVKTLIPKESDFLADGVLYYRVRGLFLFPFFHFQE